jgi:hypothetical protein
MNDQPDKGERKHPKPDPRQDRLKLALRENLKRRKSQAKGRSGVTIASSEHGGPSPHDPDRKAE